MARNPQEGLVSAVAFSNTAHRFDRSLVLVVAAAALLVWLLLAFRGHEAHPGIVAVAASSTASASSARPTAEPTPNAAAPKPSLDAAPSAKPQEPDSPGTVGHFDVPKVGTRARQRPWVEAAWGKGERQLGLDYLSGGTETYTPQGFVATRDGKLLVLDSNNRRVVQYDDRGRIERTLSVDPLVMPADVALARDGTLIVTDHGGVQTRGILLLRPDGSSRELQGIQPSEMVGMYAVGNDFWFEVGEGSVHGGNTQGELGDETPGVYNDEDSEVVPGLVAPDGKTVITIGADEESLPRGEFFVSAIRGEPPEHLFTHYFTWPRRLAAISYADADDQGRVYAVVVDGPSGADALVCMDREGHGVGTVSMGKRDQWPGRMLRSFAVVPSGGLVVMHPSEDGVRYDWYDCH